MVVVAAAVVVAVDVVVAPEVIVVEIDHVLIAEVVIMIREEIVVATIGVVVLEWVEAVVADPAAITMLLHAKVIGNAVVVIIRILHGAMNAIVVKPLKMATKVVAVVVGQEVVRVEIMEEEETVVDITETVEVVEVAVSEVVETDLVVVVAVEVVVVVVATEEDGAITVVAEEVVQAEAAQCVIIREIVRDPINFII